MPETARSQKDPRVTFVFDDGTEMRGAHGVVVHFLLHHGLLSRNLAALPDVFDKAFFDGRPDAKGRTYQLLSAVRKSLAGKPVSLEMVSVPQSNEMYDLDRKNRHGRPRKSVHLTVDEAHEDYYREAAKKPPELPGGKRFVAVRLSNGLTVFKDADEFDGEPNAGKYGQYMSDEVVSMLRGSDHPLARILYNVRLSHVHVREFAGWKKEDVKKLREAVLKRYGTGSIAEEVSLEQMSFALANGNARNAPQPSLAAEGMLLVLNFERWRQDQHLVKLGFKPRFVPAGLFPNGVHLTVGEFLSAAELSEKYIDYYYRKGGGKEKDPTLTLSDVVVPLHKHMIGLVKNNVWIKPPEPDPETTDTKTAGTSSPRASV